MAELLPQERLQPSLLDRLSDDHPELDEDVRSKVLLNLAQLRASVLRDLRWLLNTIHLEATHDLSNYPEVASSTLNYGIPSLSGTSIAGINSMVLQRAVRRAIVNFEPRILANSVNVEVRPSQDQLDRQTLVLTIEGQLWARPQPQNLYLRTELDLETGTVTVDESAR
jgi:type VI secretion system protein ImpF